MTADATFALPPRKRPLERISGSSEWTRVLLRREVSGRALGGYAAAVSRLTTTPAQRLVDAALVLGVFVIASVEMGSQSFGEATDSARTTDAAGVALCALSAIPLMLRRRAPLVALVIMLVAGVALVALDYAVLHPLGPAIALATLADRSERAAARPAAAVTLLAFAAFVALAWLRFGPELEDYVVTALLWGGGWVFGDRRRLARQRAAQERERVAREQRLAVAEERSRIARELHDSAGHAINSILIQAGAARTVLDSQPPRAREAIETIESLAHETIDDLDVILGRLRSGESADLAPLPGLGQIARLVERHRAGGLDVSLIDRARVGPRLAPAIDRTAYRIAQEALTNAARHGTGSAQVTIERRNGELRLTVTNPVAGPTAARSTGGHGLPGMRERVELLGGTLHAGRDGDRFLIRAALPYSEQTHDRTR
jgi:signal transduction histidine kinase